MPLHFRLIDYRYGRFIDVDIVVVVLLPYRLIYYCSYNTLNFAFQLKAIVRFPSGFYFTFKLPSSFISSNLINNKISFYSYTFKLFFFFALCHCYPFLPLSSCQHMVLSCRLKHAGSWAFLATCCAAPVTCSGS